MEENLDFIGWLVPLISTVVVGKTEANNEQAFKVDEKVADVVTNVGNTVPN